MLGHPPGIRDVDSTDVDDNVLVCGNPHTRLHGLYNGKDDPPEGRHEVTG